MRSLHSDTLSGPKVLSDAFLTRMSGPTARWIDSALSCRITHRRSGSLFCCRAGKRQSYFWSGLAPRLPPTRRDPCPGSAPPSLSPTVSLHFLGSLPKWAKSPPSWSMACFSFSPNVNNRATASNRFRSLVHAACACCHCSGSRINVRGIGVIVTRGTVRRPTESGRMVPDCTTLPVSMKRHA